MYRPNRDKLKNQFLSEIVNSNIDTAEVFEKYKIQYYCNPNQTLKYALEENRIDKVISELEVMMENTDDEKNISKKNLIELSNYILTVHHSFVRKALQEIVEQINEIKVKHTFKSINELENLVALLSKDMTLHMEKEEKILFPLIKYLVDTEIFHERPKTRNYGTVRNPIRQMLFEHETALEIINRIYTLLTAILSEEAAKKIFPRFFSLLKEFEIDLHKHIHLENNVLFPKTIELETRLLHN